MNYFLKYLVAFGRRALRGTLFASSALRTVTFLLFFSPCHDSYFVLQFFFS